MTLAEARADLIAQTALDVDLFKGVTVNSEGNTVEEATGATELINRACVWWATLTQWSYDPAVTLTLSTGLTAITSKYNCRSTSVVGKRILKPRFVFINGNPLYDPYGKQGLWTLADLTKEHPQWRDETATTPRRAVWLPTNYLLLNGPTDSAYTSYIEGWTLPDTLVVGQDDDTQLSAPEEDHSAIVRLAIAFGSMPMVSESEAWQRISAMDGFWRDAADRRKRESMSVFLGTRPRGANPDWMTPGGRWI